MHSSIQLKDFKPIVCYKKSTIKHRSNDASANTFIIF